MFVFAHTGIGSTLVRPWRRNLPRKMILLGTLLPDLIDKSLYYGATLLRHLDPGGLDIISGTRTFGHTALFLLILSWIAVIRGSRPLAALALGVATHLLLDGFGDTFGPDVPGDGAASALLWPLTGWRFPWSPYGSLSEHLSAYAAPFFLWAEAIGLALLVLDFGETRLRRARRRDSRSIAPAQDEAAHDLGLPARATGSPSAKATSPSSAS
jgi:hypothetical protein